MDVQMPVMDGVEATKVIRQKYSTEQLSIIAFTSDMLPDEVAQYKKIGFNDHIGKPFDRDVLIKLVKQYSH
jgi:CheY-like chemotaxis protein